MHLPTNGPPHPGPLLPGRRGRRLGPSSLAASPPPSGGGTHFLQKSASSRRRLRGPGRFLARSVSACLILFASNVSVMLCLGKRIFGSCFPSSFSGQGPRRVCRLSAPISHLSFWPTRRTIARAL